MEVEHNIAVRRYLGMFFLGYLAAYIVIIAVVYFLNIERFSASAIVAMFGGASAASGSFIKREMRAPSQPEKKKLVWGSLAIMVIFELVVAAASIAFGALDELQEGLDTLSASGGYSAIIIMVAVMMLIMATIAFFMLRWLYGSQAEKAAEKFNEKRIGKTFD